MLDGGAIRPLVVCVAFARVANEHRECYIASQQAQNCRVIACLMQTLERLNEAELLAHFATLVGRDRKNTVELIRCIIEIDQRKLWAKAACSSLFVFVTERFHLSEAAAGKRIHVARVAQRFPVVLDMPLWVIFI